MEPKRRGVRLVLFPCPFQGHINPMLQLASILHSKGFSITLVHPHFNSPNSSNYPDFVFIPIPDGISDTPASMSADVVATLALLNVNCPVPLRDCLARLLSDTTNSGAEAEAEAEAIPCIISDSLMHFTQGVADSLKLPRLVLRTSSVECSLVFNAFPVLRQKGYLPISDSELETPITELPPLKVKDIPVLSTHDPEILYQFVSNMLDQIRASSGIIWNSFYHLEQSGLTKFGQQFPIPMFTIGRHRPDAAASPFFTRKASPLPSSTLSSTLPTHPITLTSSSSPYPTASRIPQLALISADVVATLALLNVNCAVPFRDCLIRLLSDTSNSSAEAEAISSGLCVSTTISDSELETLVTELPPLKVKDPPVLNMNDPDTLYQLVEGPRGGLGSELLAHQTSPDPQKVAPMGNNPSTSDAFSSHPVQEKKKTALGQALGRPGLRADKRVFAQSSGSPAGRRLSDPPLPLSNHFSSLLIVFDELGLVFAGGSNYRPSPFRHVPPPPVALTDTINQAVDPAADALQADPKTSLASLSPSPCKPLAIHSVSIPSLPTANPTANSHCHHPIDETINLSNEIPLSPWPSLPFSHLGQEIKNLYFRNRPCLIFLRP
ncbi:hypothetical protein NE237_003574 [Protea cynaroides]|uniref:Uncharacterized protein n=1 Tax=Protea cynaroides TaxID=273540 RepID=A0A9Q0KHC5_9MAGN|nr:hypothetical protein NE237_003574 [Protea cynaroides]